LLDRLIGVVVTLGFFAKFFAFFVSFAAYSFWFGSWQFGLGFILLILVHELGHVVEAKRQGIPVTLPTFIPFFGAFVTVQHAGVAPYRKALVSLAGPLAGGLAAAAVWAYGSADNIVWRAANETWRLPRIRYENGVPMEAFAPDRGRAVLILTFYALLAAALVGGMLATRHSGML
jgi:Zn-dependent protease